MLACMTTSKIGRMAEKVELVGLSCCPWTGRTDTVLGQGQLRVRGLESDHGSASMLSNVPHSTTLSSQHATYFVTITKASSRT